MELPDESWLMKNKVLRKFPPAVEKLVALHNTSTKMSSIPVEKKHEGHRTHNQGRRSKSSSVPGEKQK
jgi:hypothetical protein